MFRQLLFVAVFLLSTSTVNASIVVLDQVWTQTGGTALTLDTRAGYDDAALTGIGIEDAALFAFSVLQRLNGAGQLFNVGLLPTGAGFARYDGGIFQYILTTSGIPLRTPNAAGVPNGSVAISALGASLLHSFQVNGQQSYNLTSTVLPPAIEPPSAVPVPAAIWLFGAALIGLFGVRKRNKTLAPLTV